MDSKIVILNKAELDQWRERLLRDIRQEVAEVLTGRETEPTWLTEEQTRKYLNLGRTSLYKLRRDGKIPFTQRGRKIQYRREDLEKFLLETISTKT